MGRIKYTIYCETIIIPISFYGKNSIPHIVSRC